MVSNNQKLHLDYSEHKHNTTAGGSETAGSQQQQSAPETAWMQSKTGTSCREPTATRTSATAGMPAATRCARNSMVTSKKQGLHAGSQQHWEGQQQQEWCARNSMDTSENRGCREPTALRTSQAAGMPAETRCARISMVTSKNRDFMQGVNNNKNVTNCRVDSSSIIRQLEYLGSSRDACNNRPALLPATTQECQQKHGGQQQQKQGGQQQHAWTLITARNSAAKGTPETVGTR